jgi:hypothetical protein
MLLSRRARPLFASLAVVLSLVAWAPRPARGAVCGGGTPTACGSPTAVTYNGVAMTLAGSSTNGTVRSEIWYLKAPASGAHNVVVTAPDATDVTATSMSFTGVDLTASLGTSFVSDIGTSTAPSVTAAASGLGSIVFDALGAVGSTTPTVSGNQIVRRTNNTSTGLNPVVIGSSTAAGQTTAVTMSWTIPSADWALSALPIPPASPLTAVGIGAFTASWRADGVLLEWQGGYEPKSAGFLVYRSDGAGERIQLNADLIPGDAFSGRASSYSWADQTSGWNGAVSYWLKDVKVDGSFTWIGPASPISLGAAAPGQAPVPVQSADGGAASAATGKGAIDDGLGGCALADHARGRAGLQLLFVLGMIVSARRRKHRLIVAALFLAGGIATNLGRPGPVAAAGGVSIDASATATGASGLTFSHTMGAGSNGLIVVGVVVPIICQTTSTTDSGNCGACGNTCAVSVASSIDVGLLGLWHFSEGSGTTSVDSSGTGNTATMTATPSWVTGYSGNGLELNGTISASANVGTWFGSNNTLSAAGWVYVTSTTNGPIFGVVGTTWNMPFLSIAGTTVYGGLWNGSAIVSRSATVTANAWHYLALTYDPAAGGTMKFYVDGALSGMATVTYVGSGIADSWTTSIPGAKPAGVNSVLKGKIDEIRAYDRVLSLAEVSALYTARLACNAGVCDACPMGQAACGGVCVTTATDISNCGGCGIVCNAAGGETCISSVCNCAVGTDCSTFCISTTSDPNNCGGCGIACGAPTPTGVDSGLLGHWHLNEGTGSTSADSSGNGNTAVLTGSPTWSTQGYVGDALTFNGTSNYAEAPIGTWFGSNNTLSVSAWVYATSTTNGPIFGVTQSNPPGSWNMPFLSINGATAWVGLWTGSAGNYVSATVSLNNWHHLAMTYDPAGSGTRKFYVDGALSATTTMTYGGSNAFDYWATYIPGDKPTGVSAYFKGTLDEVRAYNRALTAAEIQLIYYARQSCSSSACGGCQNSETLCSGVCTEQTIDPSNCGSCGHACNTAGGETCVAGVCGCASGTDCSGVCVDTTTSQSNCGMCGNACGAATCSSCDSTGVLGSWQLDEGMGTTSADASGNGNTVTFSVPPPTWTTGHTGAMSDHALTFTAASSMYINATIGPWFGANNPLSASVWVYATSTTHGPVFGVTSVKPGTGWNMPFLSVNGANVYGWIYNNTVMTTTMSLNAWHQLTVTYDPVGSPTSRLYVDGALAKTGTGSYTNSGVTDYLTTYIMGAKPAGMTNSYLNGTIDDLRAYKRVLSAGEISLLYSAQTTCAASVCGGCPSGTSSCPGSVCTDLTLDKNNCGTCGIVCSGGTPNCIASTCQ